MKLIKALPRRHAEKPLDILMNRPSALKLALFDSLRGSSALTCLNRPDCRQPAIVGLSRWSSESIGGMSLLALCMHTVLNPAPVLTPKEVTRCDSTHVYLSALWAWHMTLLELCLLFSFLLPRLISPVMILHVCFIVVLCYCVWLIYHLANWQKFKISLLANTHGTLEWFWSFL